MKKTKTKFLIYCLLPFFISCNLNFESVDGTLIYNELLELTSNPIENLPTRRQIVVKR